MIKCSNKGCFNSAKYLHKGINIYLCESCLIDGGFGHSKGFILLGQEYHDFKEDD